MRQIDNGVGGKRELRQGYIFTFFKKKKLLFVATTRSFSIYCF